VQLRYISSSLPLTTSIGQLGTLIPVDSTLARGTPQTWVTNADSASSGGSFGCVHRAQMYLMGVQDPTPLEVAVKVPLLSEYNLSSQANLVRDCSLPNKYLMELLQRYRREAEIWRRLRHDNILPFLGDYTLDQPGKINHAETGGPTTYLVSAWAAGGSVNTFLRSLDDDGKSNREKHALKLVYHFLAIHNI
jgi:serine/threonine protein kinase